LPALNLWLSYSDFNTSHGQTTCAGFNGYDSGLLAPTKLHSAQLNALQLALTNRLSFIDTRISQLNTVLGTIVQNLSDGSITSSSGLYGERYSFMNLRLNTLGGSLIQLNSLNNSSSAQDQIVANLRNTQAVYATVIKASAFAASANNTNTINIKDIGVFSPGDTVYVVSATQPEILRAVKSVNGKAITLNDSVSQKYLNTDSARIYKVL
jgi:hypothetical protein